MSVNTAKVRRATPAPRPPGYPIGRIADRASAKAGREIETRLDELITRLGAIERQLSHEARARSEAETSGTIQRQNRFRIFDVSHHARVLREAFNGIFPATIGRAASLSSSTYILFATLLVTATVMVGAAVALKQGEMARAAVPLSSQHIFLDARMAREQAQRGLAYLNGHGVPRNIEQAVRFLTPAALSGEPVAQYWLGTLYEHGNGEPANPTMAKRLYEASAMRGNVRAMYKLAVAYAEGLGTPQSYQESARWFIRAANFGFVNAQYNLGVLYERGLGVTQSLDDAYKWYALAAANGDTASSERVEILSSQMSADELAAARGAAAEFKPQEPDPSANWIAPSTASGTVATITLPQ